ncbi:unnamed protein product [Durusdinium trenchii]|uniref:EF-hand domain-containing protein n=1 Tax=Durusdinium trenchii TaxID=1381693 RepID=A0ABP0SRN9_9DINO
MMTGSARPNDARWLSTQVIVERRPQMVQCVEDGSLNKVATETFRSIDREGVGQLTWNSGAIRDFITQVLARFELPAPPENQVYQLYLAFDRDKSGSLSLSECLRLVEAIVRAAFSIKFELFDLFHAMWRLLPLGVAALHDVLELDDAQGVQEGTLGNSPAFHALQISVSSTGETVAQGPPDSLQLSVSKALQPWLTAELGNLSEVSGCGRCLRSCLPGEDQHFRGQGSYETCVARCGGGCQPGFPPAADFFHEGVRGPNENDWAVWILSLHNLQHQLSTLPWAQGSGEFDSPEFRRSSNAFVTVQTMIHDRKLYDPVRNTYTAVAYLNDLKDRFGGVDQVLLWAGYPNLGVDTRSNLDLMDSLPGGLHSAVDAFRQANPKLLIQLPYKPWDIATNGLGQHDPSRYADLMARAGADGLNLDTMDSLGPFVVPPSQSKPEMPVTEFFAAARQAGLQHAIIEPELGLYDGLFLLNTTAQGWLYTLAQCPPVVGCSERTPFAPLVSLQKWIARGSMPHVCGRWSTQRSQEILTAYFNAIGYAAWENIFGIWNGINPRDAELLKRAMLILRHFGHFLSDPGVAWLPFYPVQKLTSKGENVYVSKFVGSDRELFLIINTGLQTADAQDWMLQVPQSDHFRFYDLYRGDDVHLERVNTCLVKSCNERIHRAQTAQLHLSVEGGGIGAILKVRVGKMHPNDRDFLRRMGTATEKPLSSFADKVSLAKQTYHPGDGGAGTLSNTGGMVVVNGSAAFEFRVVGSEIEDTYRGGQNFVKLGVDVQFPWEDEAVKYHVAHNVSIKDLLVDKFPVTNEMFAAFLKETSYVPVAWSSLWT